ncbi:unnamed protein product [Nyctereutes procyonoides]|uniref:6-pyruvoyltetrahydropterin synthase n=1 Tax=Nyctereutes procyonoides TaxID=34880 RepID=A0A811YGG5_NYCPR|nr:unnamed protein product [Nyctereutes procyonoides]
MQPSQFCNRKNYKVVVIVHEESDPVIAKVMNVTNLKEYMEALRSPLIKESGSGCAILCRNVVKTTENIVVYIWENLQKLLLGVLYKSI